MGDQSNLLNSWVYLCHLIDKKLLLQSREATKVLITHHTHLWESYLEKSSAVENNLNLSYVTLKSSGHLVFLVSYKEHLCEE